MCRWGHEEMLSTDFWERIEVGVGAKSASHLRLYKGSALYRMLQGTDNTVGGWV